MTEIFLYTFNQQLLNLLIPVLTSPNLPTIPDPTYMIVLFNKKNIIYRIGTLLIHKAQLDSNMETWHYVKDTLLVMKNKFIVDFYSFY